MHSKSVIIFSLSLFLFSSCVNSRKAVYFNNIQDTTITNTVTTLDPVIQSSDLLNISVSSLNPEASMLFNTPNITMPVTTTSSGTTPTSGGFGTSQLMGYLVSQEGVIKFPILGRFKAAGLTKRQLEDAIADTLTARKLLVDPIVTVRFLNFRVTILGEVARPTTLNVANERISILEALGLAGDLTIYAKRDNVLLIRESDGGKKLIKRIDLNANEILSSPYYYLKTNDIVYVEPRKEKVAATSRTQQLLPIILSGLSLVAVIVLHYVK